MIDKFVCGICGKEHANVANRAACEAACLKRLEIEEKRQAEIKMREERAERTAKLNNLCDQFIAEHNAYIRDYGSYNYNGKYHNEVTWPNIKSLFHFFM